MGIQSAAQAGHWELMPLRPCSCPSIQAYPCSYRMRPDITPARDGDTQTNIVQNDPNGQLNLVLFWADREVLLLLQKLNPNGCNPDPPQMAQLNRKSLYTRVVLAINPEVWDSRLYISVPRGQIYFLCKICCNIYVQNISCMNCFVNYPHQIVHGAAA